MKWKELTKTLMMISNWKNPLVSTVHMKIINTLAQHWANIGSLFAGYQYFSFLTRELLNCLFLFFIHFTLSSLVLPLFYHYHLHPLQAANCCRNYRLVVDEDDSMWFKNLRKLPSFMEIFVLKPFVLGKLGMFSWMWNDALMHRKGLEG